MVVTLLNASPTEAAAQELLSHHLTPFTDVDIIVAQTHYPAHRAVLAIHSIEFRELFSNPLHTSSTPTPITSNTSSPLSRTRATTPINNPRSPMSSTASPTIVVTPSPSFPLPNQQQQQQQQHPISSNTTNDKLLQHSQLHAQQQTERHRIHIAIDELDDNTLRSGWGLIYSYIYGATINLNTDIVLSALPICKRYKFNELSVVLDAYLCDAAVSPRNCTRVYAASGLKSYNIQSVSTTITNTTNTTNTNNNNNNNTDSDMVQNAAWNVMKNEFSKVVDWGIMPYGSLVRLLKLNDLNILNELSVFEAVTSWISHNQSSIDDDSVAGLVKLVRFPTMSIDELEICAASDLVKVYPVCRKYVSRGLAARADEKRGLIRNVVMESSPVYRKRRTDALTFSDRVNNWRRVEKSVHTSSRYFAGCLWNLIVEIPENINNDHDRSNQWIGLYLGCLSETEDKEVDVELDFSVFIVKHTGGSEPDLITKQVKGACFSRSGQRIGFPKMMKRSDIEMDGGRFLLRDTLFIGASIRLRSSSAPVIGITERDDTSQSISTNDLNH